MALIPEVKCKRCDRRFSGVRSRCPYCGTRRGARGKHADSDDSYKGKATVGVLILSAIVIAVAALLFTSLSDEGEDPGATGGPSGAVITPTPSLFPNSENGGDSVDGLYPTISPTPTPEPTATPEPIQNVEVVQITYSGVVKTDFTVDVGEKVALKVKTLPVQTDEQPIWESSDEDVFMVTEDGVVTGTGKKDRATLTVTVNGVSAECIVYGSGRAH
jgi:DNA-directed RNA polymerase subunit RPC12/RpoP